MPVRNGAKYVGATVRSVLRQSLRDFELWVLDDGSTDDTVAIVESFRDARVRVVRHSRQQGIATLLNEGLSLARAELVARIDADDIARPNRLGIQKACLDSRSELAALGTAARFFGREPWVRVSPPTTADSVRAFMVFDNPLLHPTVMLRRSLLQAHGLAYRSEFSKSEDFDLWERLAQVTAVDNLDTVTMHIRVHPSSVTTSPGNEMEDQTRMILARGLARLGLRVDSEQLQFHRKVGHGVRMETVPELERARGWVERLLEANRRTQAFPEAGFRTAVAAVWFRVCRNSAAVGPPAWRAWRTGPRAGLGPSLEDTAWFWAGMLRHSLFGR